MTWYQRPRDPQQQHGFDVIGATIKRRRASLGWTQRYLEAQCGLDQTVISRIENGKQYGLRWSRFADLVEALGGLDVALAPWGARGPRMPAVRDPDIVRPIERVDRVDLTEGPDDSDEDF